MTNILSIGHSTLTYSSFLSLLRSENVTAIADVRTSPFSRHFPHFNQDELKESLLEDGIAYVFLGKELGGRPKGKAFYSDGVADYEKMAESPIFNEGIERVISGSKSYRIAMMCSERHPLDCHRCLLVGRELKKRGINVHHIMSDGSVIDQGDVENKLLEMSGKKEADMFSTADDLLAEAYKKRAKKVAFSENKKSDKVAYAGQE